MRPVNVFSTDAFLNAVAQTGFKGQGASIEPYDVNGQAFRLLRVQNKVITRYPFLDFHEPVDAVDGSARPLGYLPRAAVTRIPAEQWTPEEGVEPSPLIDWSQFGSLEAFWQSVGKRRGNLAGDSRRKLRQLERDLGPVEFTFDDRRADAFNTCLRWKSAQYRRSGLVDLFAERRHVDLFRHLQDSAIVVVSSLRAGDILISAHLGALHEGRMYWWIPAYDPTFSRYAPGRLMLHALIEHSQKSGHREFDFLIGEEGYKWYYATHTRVVQPWGSMPLPLRATVATRKAAKKMLGSVGLWEKLRGLKQRWRQRGSSPERRSADESRARGARPFAAPSAPASPQR